MSKSYDMMQAVVEKALKYKWWDKERERSNRAAAMAASGVIARMCPLRHTDIAWVGPPHDLVKAYVCINCHAMASEPEIKDRNIDFDAAPDWIIKEIFDLDLGRQAMGKKTFGMYTG